MTIVLRDLVITNENSQSPARMQLYIVSGTKNYLLFLEAAVPSLTSRHLELRQEILAGDVLTAYSDQTDWSTVVTGYELGA